MSVLQPVISEISCSNAAGVGLEDLVGNGG